MCDYPTLNTIMDGCWPAGNAIKTHQLLRAEVLAVVTEVERLRAKLIQWDKHGTMCNFLDSPCGDCEGCNRDKQIRIEAAEAEGGQRERPLGKSEDGRTLRSIANGTHGLHPKDEKALHAIADRLDQQKAVERDE